MHLFLGVGRDQDQKTGVILREPLRGVNPERSVGARDRLRDRSAVLHVVQGISLKGRGTQSGNHTALYPHNEILRFAPGPLACGVQLSRTPEVQKSRTPWI